MNFFKKLLAFLKKWWWVILILVAVFYPPFMAFLTKIWAAMKPMLAKLWVGAKGVVGALGWKGTAAVALGTLAAVSPETVTKMADNIGEAAKGVASTAVDVVGSAASSILSNPVVLVGGGLTLLLLLGSRKRV